MAPQRLRTQCLPEGAGFSHLEVVVDGKLAGNVFACRREYRGRVVCWITQLVVDVEYRERGLASSLLQTIAKDNAINDDIFGIISSHPAACIALAQQLGSKKPPTALNMFSAEFSLDGIDSVKLDFIRENARSIMDLSPVSYVREAQLRGELFGDTNDDTVSSVFTNFFVDHEELLEALEWVKEHRSWPLGELHEGHEFLLLLERRVRRRSRSRLTS